MGSNMAEQHPVGFQWVMEAKARGAKVIHVDPRFTRTSAVADRHVPIRPGSDIAFVGGLINYIFEHDAWFHEYVKHYTNAPAIIREDFVDSEDGDGFFSGWDPEQGSYDTTSWGYAETDSGGPDTSGEQSAQGGHGIELDGGEPPHLDPTMEHERSVLQITRRHFARYTPRTGLRHLRLHGGGVPRRRRRRCAPTPAASAPRRSSTRSAGPSTRSGSRTSGRARSCRCCWATWDAPGGGILALRGHANIQGSTDIPTLYNILPGYIPMPQPDQHPDLDTFVETSGPSTRSLGRDAALRGVDAEGVVGGRRHRRQRLLL